MAVLQADYSDEFQEIDNKLFQCDRRLFEPEYTDAELQELRERATRQRELPVASPGDIVKRWSQCVVQCDHTVQHTASLVCRDATGPTPCNTGTPVVR